MFILHFKQNIFLFMIYLEIKQVWQKVKFISSMILFMFVYMYCPKIKMIHYQIPVMNEWGKHKSHLINVLVLVYIKSWNDIIVNAIYWQIQKFILLNLNSINVCTLVSVSVFCGKITLYWLHSTRVTHWWHHIGVIFF